MVKKAIVSGLRGVLPKRVREALFHLSFGVAPEEFRKFAFLYAYACNMEMGLARLKKRGFDPKSIVDVGAFRGDWARLAHSLWPEARLVIFEPNPELAEPLRGIAAELGAEFYPELMGADDGSNVTFHVMGAGSSVFEERSVVTREAQTRTLRTLDGVLADWEGIGLLKIDAQGYELQVLRGASRLLAATDSVLLEISLIEINRGAPLLDEVVAFMKSHGFLACEILEIHRRPLDKALNQVDFLFVREDSPLFADKRHGLSSPPTT